MTTTRSIVDRLPVELLSAMASHLDVCSLWNLLDTCKRCRYSLLASTSIWRRLEFNLDDHDLHAVYRALRRFRDSNGLGLRLFVEEVVMDGTDDSMISPIVMIVKFPKMRQLSCKHRRFNTNLEADAKILQELIKRGSLQKGTLALEEMDLFHYFMDNEPHLDVFQRTLDRLSYHGKVELDIRRCQDQQQSIHLPPSPEQRQQQQQQQQQQQLRSEVEDSLSHRLNGLQLNHTTTPSTSPSMSTSIQTYCTRIISKNARCWACDHPLERCWRCMPHCRQCKAKQLPPLANDRQRKQRSEPQKMQRLTTNQMDQDLREEFALFE